MANKRDLKKSLSYASSELFAICVASYLTAEKDNHDSIDATLKGIIKTHSEFVSRVSHPEPGMKPKTYYKTLIEDFNKQVGELIDQIEAM